MDDGRKNWRLKFLSFKTVFLYLSSWMLHGSAKIASLSSEMSLLEKAPTSIFDEDQSQSLRDKEMLQLLAFHHFV